MSAAVLTPETTTKKPHHRAIRRAKANEHTGHTQG